MRCELLNGLPGRNESLGIGWIVLWLLIGGWSGPSAWADTIILKDGTSEEAERVWETEKFVHFILPGTQTVEIRYNKAIVERIITQNQVEQVQTQSSNINPTAVALPSDRQEALPARSASASHSERIPEPADSLFIAEVKGISFYAPQRAERYWAGPDSRHHDLQSALDALADRYGRSIEWICAHMGEENELGNIHARLVARYQAEKRIQVVPGTATRAPGVGDPRSSLPGASNGSPGSAKLSAAAAHELGGLKFYEPRSAQKYRTDSQSQFTTLDEALDALAVHYGFTAQWIAEHMGETNDLYQIHQNIRRELSIP